MATYTITSKNGQPFAILDESDNRAQARATAKEVNGTVRTATELAEYIAKFGPKVEAAPAPVVEVVAPAAAGDWVGMANEIKATTKAVNTLGKKEKATKRVITSAAVLAEAEAIMAMHVLQNKVDTVRQLAAWVSEIEPGVKLQRRDCVSILASTHPEISAATVGTQFQLVRSGKLNK